MAADGAMTSILPAPPDDRVVTADRGRAAAQSASPPDPTRGCPA
jgi:hypothetical protein